MSNDCKMPPGEQVQVLAGDVREGDVVVEWIAGQALATHVHSILLRRPLVEFVDCDGDSHLHNVNAMLTIIRKPA